MKFRRYMLGLMASVMLCSIAIVGCSKKAPVPDKPAEVDLKADADQGKSAMPGGGPPGDKK